MKIFGFTTIWVKVNVCRAWMSSTMYKLTMYENCSIGELEKEYIFIRQLNPLLLILFQVHFTANNLRSSKTSFQPCLVEKKQNRQKRKKTKNNSMALGQVYDHRVCILINSSFYDPHIIFFTIFFLVIYYLFP